MRRQSTSSDGASIISHETTASLVKHEPADAAETKDTKRDGIRQKARRVLADMGAPPTARQDAKDGRRTLNYADPGGLIGDAMSKPVKF
ncbi:hypothetical protein LLEC1_08132 [Akanthomyces lecanii]|uniref:Uncharacterized protein n=1 Tax=Cordyceps confragosa TaxID=2714763 RepID=A0A179IAM2_CORDF|nr:hypothetical protein LLEC1_08132 [Akanthomyces lecanii]